MWFKSFIVLAICILQSPFTLSWNPCVENNDCLDIDGAVCVSDTCACPAGEHIIFGNSVCSTAPPYLTSPCYENQQCSILVTNFQCLKATEAAGENEPGECACRDGYRFFHSRCWRSIEYGNSCIRNEECIGHLRDPFSMSCDSATRTCRCAEGYYLRQTGECRKRASNPNDGCVIDEDCPAERPRCNLNTLRCVGAVSRNVLNIDESLQNILQNVLQRQLQNSSVAQQNGRGDTQHGAYCNSLNTCGVPFVCSSYGICTCPVGYYGLDGDTTCYAEFGSRSTAEQCVGLFAEVTDGVCTCPANFLFEPNSRNCMKVSRTITDSCVTDDMCLTFGLHVRCGAPSQPWNVRSCECVPGRSVWVPSRNMCRSFVGLGEQCQMSGDCLAGDREIECAFNTEGEGVCSCPAGSVEQDGLCLTMGLELGDECQVSDECSGTANNMCEDRRCSCGAGYFEVDGSCAIGIGGVCTDDEECVTENTVCATESGGAVSTCACASNYIRVGDQCIPVLSDIQSPCNLTEQCVHLMGKSSVCEEGKCQCTENTHLKDGMCWQRIGLFQDCSRTSECYLQGISERVVCRNSLCQCGFDYPYLEEQNTCSSALKTTGGIFAVLLTLYYVLL